MFVNHYLLLTITLQPATENRNYILITRDNQSFISDNLKLAGLLGEKLIFHSPGNSNQTIFSSYKHNN